MEANNIMNKFTLSNAIFYFSISRVLNTFYILRKYFFLEGTSTVCVNLGRGISELGDKRRC